MHQPREPDRLCSQAEQSITSSLDAIADLLNWFEACWPAPAADADTAQEAHEQTLKLQAQTALVEAFSNAVRHAHADLDPAPDVILAWHSDRDRFSLQVIDRGSRFAPEQCFATLREHLASGAAHPSQRDRGWGLLMFVRLCDQHGWSIASEQLSQGGNCLSLSHAWALPAGSA